MFSIINDFFKKSNISWENKMQFFSTEQLISLEKVNFLEYSYNADKMWNQITGFFVGKLVITRKLETDCTNVSGIINLVILIRF